jgi:hypothetical protein
MAFYIYSKNKIIRTQNLSIRQNRNQVLTTNNNETNMRPFDSSFQIQPIPEEEEVVNTVTPIEHKGNRLIIDDVLEEMQNT